MEAIISGYLLDGLDRIALCIDQQPKHFQGWIDADSIKVPSAIDPRMMLRRRMYWIEFSLYSTELLQ